MEPGRGVLRPRPGMAPHRRRQPRCVDGWARSAPGGLDVDHPRRWTPRRRGSPASSGSPYAGATPCRPSPSASWARPAAGPRSIRANRAQLSDPDELTPGQQLDPAEVRGGRAGAKPSPPIPSPWIPVSDRSSGPPTPRARAASDHSHANATAHRPRRSRPRRRSTRHRARASDDASALDVALPLAAVGGLLAAGLVQGLAWRRQVQLQARPIGRRLLQPPAATQPVAVALGRRQRPLSLRSLDRAMRAIAAHCRTTKTPPPPLRTGHRGRRADRTGDERSRRQRTDRLSGTRTVLDPGPSRRRLPQLRARPRRITAAVAGPGHPGSR